MLRKFQQQKRDITEECTSNHRTNKANSWKKGEMQRNHRYEQVRTFM